MAEDCDPAVLHARLCVVESDSKRHEADISRLFGKVNSLEVCASSLPKIEKALEKIQEKVDSIRSNDECEAGKSIAYLTLREWAILAIAIMGILLDHFVVR